MALKMGRINFERVVFQLSEVAFYVMIFVYKVISVAAVVVVAVSFGCFCCFLLSFFRFASLPSSVFHHDVIL